MAEGAGSGTAAERLERVLWLIPRVCREEGADLDELAAELGVSRDTVLRDLTETAARAHYNLAGSGDDIQITFHGDRRVTVWTKGDFRRPPRLGTREALALELALRCRPEEGSEALSRLLLGALSALHPDEVEGGRFLVDPGRREMEGAGGPLFRAARRRLPCRLLYLKPGGEAPEERTVRPWAMLRAEGHWYAVGLDPEAEGETAGFEGLRIFRLDRVIEARIAEGAEPFEVPEGFDPRDVIDGGRVYAATADDRARVRYGPDVVAWVREWVEECWPEDAAAGGVSEDGDGRLVLEHAVSDPRWLVRHVLSLAGAAEVLEPAELRAAVREGAERTRRTGLNGVL